VTRAVEVDDSRAGDVSSKPFVDWGISFARIHEGGVTSENDCEKGHYGCFRK